MNNIHTNVLPVYMLTLQ